MKARSLSLVLALMIVITAAVSGCRQAAAPTTPDYLLSRDQSYAKFYGVTVDEARRRNEIQDQGRFLMQLLAENEPETYAGIFLQHTPEFRIVVLFTRDGEAALAGYTVPAAVLEVIEIRQVEYSLRYLEQSQVATGEVLRGLDIKFDGYIDVKKNEVVFHILEKDFPRLEAAAASGNITIPSGVVVEAVQELIKAE